MKRVYQRRKNSSHGQSGEFTAGKRSRRSGSAGDSSDCLPHLTFLRGVYRPEWLGFSGIMIRNKSMIYCAVSTKKADIVAARIQEIFSFFNKY